MIGDFNAITSAAEKLGGRMKVGDSIDAFNNFINRGSMVDLGFVAMNLHGLIEILVEL